MEVVEERIVPVCFRYYNNDIAIMSQLYLPAKSVGMDGLPSALSSKSQDHRSCLCRVKQQHNVHVANFCSCLVTHSGIAKHPAFTKTASTNVQRGVQRNSGAAYQGAGEEAEEGVGHGCVAEKDDGDERDRQAVPHVRPYRLIRVVSALLVRVD